MPLNVTAFVYSTKAELTAFLAKKVEERGEAVGRQIVVAWGTECEATHKDVGHLYSDREEANTKIILNALDATNDGATKLFIHSPDTDFLVLAIKWYSEICPNTSFVIGNGTNHRFIKLQLIVSLVLLREPHLLHLTPLQELIILVALQGRGKVSCCKEFQETDDFILSALDNLGREE